MSKIERAVQAERTGAQAILVPPGQRAHRLTLAEPCGTEDAAVHVTVEGPDLEELDATALPPRSTLVLRDCPRLTELRLGPIASANLHVARPAIEDSPAALRVHGSVDSIDLRFGDRHLPAAALPLGRETLDGAYIGPAAPDIPDAPIRVCFGPGALEAAARGTSARMRIALADPEGTQLHVSVWHTNVRHVRVVDCPKVERIDIGPGADDLHVENCPRLHWLDGEGRRARVVDSGAETHTLQAFGTWGRLAVVRCGYARIECATSQVFLGRDAEARAWPTIASLSGAHVAARDPDGPDGARDGPMLSGVGERTPAESGLLIACSGKRWTAIRTTSTARCRSSRAAKDWRPGCCPCWSRRCGTALRRSERSPCVTCWPTPWRRAAGVVEPPAARSSPRRWASRGAGQSPTTRTVSGCTCWTSSCSRSGGATPRVPAKRPRRGPSTTP